MTAKNSSQPSRRSLLRTAGAAAGLAATSILVNPATAVGETASKALRGPLIVRRRFQLLDDRLLQRFRLSSRKQPILHGGKTYPASMRQGPDDGTWITFNDENQDEKGGMTVSTNGESFSFDYANAQATTLSTAYEGNIGYAALSLNQQPDPSIPITEITAEDNPQRVLLHTDTAGNGALLWLCDSMGNPRISLQVDGDDVPRIQILDAQGGVVAQLPEGGDRRPVRKSAVRGVLQHLRLGLRTH